MEKAELIICLLISAAIAVTDDEYDDEDIRLPDEATGRPVPIELKYLFGNKTDRDQDMEVCMGEMLDCHRMKFEVTQKVCGRHTTAKKTFRDLCELNYVNCKAPIIDDGFDDTAGPEGPMFPRTRNPEAQVWEYSHDGECSVEIT